MAPSLVQLCTPFNDPNEEYHLADANDPGTEDETTRPGRVYRHVGCGRVRLQDRLPALACAPPRTSGLKVLAVSKMDLMRGVQARMALIAQELNVTSGESETDDAAATCRALMPQRVVLRPSSEVPLSHLQLSGYAFASEDRDDCSDRVAYFCVIHLHPLTWTTACRLYG